MRKLILLLSLIAAGSSIGCGNLSPVDSTVPLASTLHGGVLVPLGDKEVFVELLNDKRVKQAGKFKTGLVAYLLQPDQKTPLAEKPTTVSVKMNTPDGEKTIPLQPTPDSNDTAGEVRYASKLGSYDLNMVGGEVSITLGGKTLTGNFRGPR